MSAITGKTKLVGIFGWPVGHSLSPIFQNAAFEALGLDYRYVPLSVRPKDLADAVRGFRAMNFAGANLTIPHKEAVIPFLDELAPTAAMMGAVNTIEVNQGRLVGHNTDGDGFVRSLLEEGVGVAGARCLMIGAGGAARGVAVALARAGIAEIIIANRTLEKAEELASLISARIPDVTATGISLSEEALRRSAEGINLLVQTTSVGMKPGDPLPVPMDILRADLAVCDLIYSPLETPLLQQVSISGAKTINGIGMLLYQGAIAFEIWTGKAAPVEIMRKALESALSGKI